MKTSFTNSLSPIPSAKRNSTKVLVILAALTVSEGLGKKQNQYIPKRNMDKNQVSM
jgi:hypothetical protein